MFLLVGNDKTFYLTKEGKYTIGRHVGDIIIRHNLVSRKHAEIFIEKKEAYIRDCQSKFFTKLNGKILLKNERPELRDGAEITLGELKFTFKQVDTYITCCTGIKEQEAEVISIVKELGGEYLKDWNDSCTHLTTSEIMVTLKVLHSLMDDRKLVTPNFWKACLEKMKENASQPDPSEFYPPLGESMIQAKYLEYNPNRKHVFDNKTFAFWKKKRQLSMNSIISKAGGSSLLIPSIKNKTNSEILDFLDDCIVMDPEDPTLEETYSPILEAYKKRGRRIIPTQEIVLSILQCSCEENCNPLFDRAKTVFKRDTQKPGPSRVVIGETECFQVDSEMEQTKESSKPGPSRVVIRETECSQVFSEMERERKSPKPGPSRVIGETQFSQVGSEMERERGSQKPGPSRVVLGETESAEVDSLRERKPFVIPSSIDVENYVNTQNKTIETQDQPFLSQSKGNKTLTQEVEVVKTFKKESETVSGTNEKKPGPFFKRPAQDPIAPPPKKAKGDQKSLKLNPFSIMKSRIGEEGSTSRKEDAFSNPFELIQVKQDIKREDSNDDVVIIEDSNESSRKRKNEESVDSATAKKRTKTFSKKNRKFVELAPIDFSNLNHTITSGVWIEASMKDEMRSTPSNLDEEEQKWCDRFKNSVVVVVKDLWRKDKENISNISLGQGQSQVGNFKKFRKVPVPKSGQVVQCSSKIVFGNRNLGVDYQNSDDEDNRNM